MTIDVRKFQELEAVIDEVSPYIAKRIEDLKQRVNYIDLMSAQDHQPVWADEAKKGREQVTAALIEDLHRQVYPESQSA